MSSRASSSLAVSGDRAGAALATRRRPAGSPSSPASAAQGVMDAAGKRDRHLRQCRSERRSECGLQRGPDRAPLVAPYFGGGPANRGAAGGLDLVRGRVVAED